MSWNSASVPKRLMKSSINPENCLERILNKFLNNSEGMNDFVKNLQHLLREMRVGILRVEKADLDQGLLVLTVSEDLDCSGLPELNYEICTSDEGFIAGLLGDFTGGRPFR